MISPAGSGYAIQGEPHRSGIIDLPAGPHAEGRQYLRLFDALCKLVERESITAIGYEQTFIPPIRGQRFTSHPESYQQQFRLSGVIMMAAARFDIEVYEIIIADWRVHFIGTSTAPKFIKGKDARRQWLKDQVVLECQRRGHDVLDDNEADALGMLYYFHYTQTGLVTTRSGSLI